MIDENFSTSYPEQFPTFEPRSMLKSEDLNTLVAGIRANRERIEAKIGTPGPSAYDVAVANGYLGIEEEWLQSLKGECGEDGKIPYIKDDYWWIGDTNTGVKATGIGISSIEQTTTSEESKVTIQLTNNEEKTISIRTPEIKNDGYWYVNGTNTGIRAVSVLFGTSEPNIDTCPSGCIYVQYSEE